MRWVLCFAVLGLCVSALAAAPSLLHLSGSALAGAAGIDAPKPVYGNCCAPSGQTPGEERGQSKDTA
jgi:hypothetical protein